MMRCATSCCVLALLLSPRLFAEDPRKADAAPKNDADPLAVMQKEIADLNKRLDLSEQARVAEARSFNEKLDKLDKMLDNLRGVERRSSYFTPGTPGPTGTIRMVNRSAVGTIVHLEGRNFEVAPLETVVLPSLPAGNFTYSVAADGFGEIRPPLARALASGETFTILIDQPVRMFR